LIEAFLLLVELASVILLLRSLRKSSLMKSSNDLGIFSYHKLPPTSSDELAKKPGKTDNA